MITFTVILICSGSVAQDFIRSEFSINTGGGVSSFQTRPIAGKDLWSWTATAGLGYHFFFSPHWGVGTGANFAIYNGGMSFKNLEQQQDAINALTGSAFDFLVSSNFKETYQAMMVNFPLMLQYQGKGEKAFYAALGAKAGIPVSVKSLSNGDFTSKGYFPNLNVTYEDLPEFGFVNNQPLPENKAGIQLKTAFMASVELGIKWRLGTKTSLYTGIYADYTLNDVTNQPAPANTNLVVYQSGTPVQLSYNTTPNSYTRRMAPLAGGITLRLAFGKAPAPKPTPKPKPLPFIEELIPEQQDDKTVEENFEDEVEEILQAEESLLAEELEAKRLIAEKDEQEALRLTAEIEARWKAREEAKKVIMEPVNKYLNGQTQVYGVPMQQLDERVKLLILYPELNFFIIGHTCDLGTQAVNERVGLARANYAKKYLIFKGITERRILGISTKRDTEPLVPNTSEANRRINRRVELKIEE